VVLLFDLEAVDALLQQGLPDPDIGPDIGEAP